jgi:hypothetical protein
MYARVKRFLGSPARFDGPPPRNPSVAAPQKIDGVRGHRAPRAVCAAFVLDESSAGGPDDGLYRMCHP